MRIVFFKTGKYKQFNYVPRYYDEQKEESDKRQRRLESELNMNQNTDGAYRSSLQKGVMTRRIMDKKKANRSSTIRLVIILGLLFLLAYYFLTGDASINIFPK